MFEVILKERTVSVSNIDTFVIVAEQQLIGFTHQT